MKTPLPSHLSFADIEAARRRVAAVRVTPCARAPQLSAFAGTAIWLKRDDLQRTGSFKERGARNALLCLTAAQRAAGVVAASAGNHALGLAFHGSQLGIAVTVVVPETAPAVKIARCRALGANVVVHGDSFEAAQRHAAALADATGGTVIHPFDDVAVIAGQGTLGLEVVDQVSAFDTFVVPVGGGGLLAGTATAIKALRPRARVVAVEPEHAASFLAAHVCGRPARAAVLPSLADGLAVAEVGATTFSIARSLVDDVVVVTEAEIAAAIAALARYAGAVVEGAGATALAAVLAGKVEGAKIVVPVTGRNIMPGTHAQVLSSWPQQRAPRLAHAA